MSAATICCRRVSESIISNWHDGCCKGIALMWIVVHARCRCTSHVWRGSRILSSCCWSTVHVWTPKHGCASLVRIATIVNWVANIGVSMMAVSLVCAVQRTMNDKIRNYKMPFAMPSTATKSVFWIFCHRKWKSRGYRSVWKSHCCIWVCYWIFCARRTYLFNSSRLICSFVFLLACEKGAWKCVQHLVIARNDEINLIKDEYYPIHQAVLHDQRFLELLIQHGAITTVRTCTQQMTLLHVGECSVLLWYVNG